jgi:hypothetical protein
MRVSSRRFVLRDLSLPSRFLLATFLVCVGLGYVAALVQLHFHHAPAGKLLPGADETANTYHGRAGLSELERLLLAGEEKPFNGSGGMQQAFTIRSAGWKSAISRRARKNGIALRQAEAELRSQRDGERLALLAWVRAGAPQTDFEQNYFPLSGKLSNHPITEEFREVRSDGTGVKVAGIVETRCARCHSEAAGGPAAQVPLESWDQIHAFCDVQTAAGGMSLEKLAQSTHVHLFGLTMLFGMTGLLFTLTSYPAWWRTLLGTLPLLAQLAEIGCWWLGRLDPVYARAVVVLGGAAAAGLALQLVLTLFNMFGKTGKIVLLCLILTSVAGGLAAKQMLIDPYLVGEGLAGSTAE